MNLSIRFSSPPSLFCFIHLKDHVEGAGKAFLSGLIAVAALLLTLPRAEASVDYGGTGIYQSPPYSALYIGYGGQGTLTIDTATTPNDTTTLTSAGQAYLAYNPGDSGTVTVNGSGAVWTIDGQLFNGNSGTGTILIENGGVVNADGSTASLFGYPTGDSPAGSGNLTISSGGEFIATSSIQTESSAISVDGAGSLLSITTSGAGILLNEGSGAGSMSITNGGTVTLGQLGISEDGTGTSTLLVNGGNLNLNLGLTVRGTASSAQFINGAQVNSSSYIIIDSASAASTGTLLISGATTTVTTASVTLGGTGYGSLTVADGATLNASVAITVGGNTSGGNFGGTLQVGNGANSAAGILNTPIIVGGEGNGGTDTLIFDHDASAYYFTRNGTSSGAAIAIEGNTQVQVQSGTTILTSTGDTYTGGTQVTGGALLVNNASGSGTGTGSVTVGAAGTLGGSGTIAPTGSNSLTISGVLAPGTIGAIGKLTINSGGTTAAHALTLNSGASLLFNLGADNTSSNLTLVNGVAGGLVFNSNVINFDDLTAGNLASGTYQLITATSASDFSGLTYGSNGEITSGLSVGTGLGSDTGTLSLVGNSIELTLTASAPEPGTWVLMLAGLGLLVVVQRRRFRS